MMFLTTVFTTALLSTLSHATLIDGENVKPGGHPAVFGMIMNGSDSNGDESESVCTAFLVAPDLLLTAAHCLQHTYSISLIANGTNLEKTQKGTEVTSERFGGHPAFVSPNEDMSPVALQKSRSTDIGYIVLRKAAAGVTPFPVHAITDSNSAMILSGLEVTLVGYGASRFQGMNADYGTSSMLVKKQGKKTISGIRPNYAILMGEKNGALPGDSGGPEIAKINGVTKVVGLNHGMLGIKKKYGATIGTLLTKANLCWVERDSKVEIPGVDCSKK